MIWEKIIWAPEVIRRNEAEVAQLLDNLEELVPPQKKEGPKDWIDTFLIVLNWGKDCQERGLITEDERTYFMGVLVQHRCI